MLLLCLKEYQNFKYNGTRTFKSYPYKLHTQDLKKDSANIT